jgi:anti-sigma B factor antagonist
VLEITIRDGNEIVLSGRLDAAQADKVRQAFDTITDNCVIDMKDLDYISSAGLGVLLATYKRLDQSGNRMILKNMNQYIRRVFQVSGMDRLFTIEE